MKSINYEVGIVVSDTSHAVSYYQEAFPDLQDYIDVSLPQAEKWLEGVLMPILRQFLCERIVEPFTGEALGLGLVREHYDSELSQELEDYITLMPKAIMSALKTRKAIGVDLYPFNFLNNSETPDIIIAITGIIE